MYDAHDSTSTRKRMEKIGIIGMGLIGRAWAIVFARAGHPVAAWDGAAGAVDAALKAIDESLRDLAAAGLIEDPAAIRARITAAPTLEAAVANTLYVQENIVERLADKIAIYAALDRAAPADAILASSTSAIPCSQFTTALAGRHRCLVVHPVNPPYLVPLVELCGAPWTAPAIVARARALLERAGQVPITVNKEIDGFILNRLQGALVNEALRLIDQGYVSAADLDRTVKDGLGLRWSFMGPIETGDLNAPGGIGDYLARYGSLFRGLDASIRAATPWTDKVAAVVDAEQRASAPASRLAALQAWRDRRLMALLVHKRAQAKLPKP
jgi:3-hydroxyacyl-CoA dehydrogenase